MKGRITCSKLRDWVNEKFIELEITEYECTKVERTNYREMDYEGGAHRLHVYFDYKDESKRIALNYSYFPCDYSIKYLQEMVNSGHELYLREQFRKSVRLQGISALEIEYRKIK